MSHGYSYALEVEILKALGIDNTKVQAFTLTSSVFGPSEITVTYQTYDATVPTFTRKYEIKEVADDIPES